MFITLIAAFRLKTEKSRFRDKNVCLGSNLQQFNLFRYFAFSLDVNQLLLHRLLFLRGDVIVHPPPPFNCLFRFSAAAWGGGGGVVVYNVRSSSERHTGIMLLLLCLTLAAAQGENQLFSPV